MCRNPNLPGIWLAIGIALSLCGCATGSDAARAPGPGDTDMVVDRFEISGMQKLDEATLKDGLATQEDPGWRAAVPWLPLLGAQRSYFNRIEWRRDQARILSFYDRHGYFDAKIARESVVRAPEGDRVRIRLQIAEGPATRISQIRLEGAEALRQDERAALLAGLPVQKGQVFNENDYLRARSQLTDKLRAMSFAYARVRGRVAVYAEDRQARVVFSIEPGPRATFGQIRIVGAKTVPNSFIEGAIPFNPGEPYSEELLERAQEQIYDLDVFSLVSVLPAHEADQALADADENASTPDGLAQIDGVDPRVPIIVRVKEARLWSGELGAGFAIESNRQDVHGQVNWSSRNFLGGLRRLRHLNSVGYAWAFNATEGNLLRPAFLADPSEIDNQGVVFSSQLEFLQPYFIERLTTLRVQPGLRRDLEVGYDYLNPSLAVGVDRTFFGHLNVAVDYNLSYYDFTYDADALDPESTPLGVDFQERFLLEHLTQRLALDYRDSPLNPTRGFLASLSAQQANRYLFGGEFNYLKWSASAAGYVPFDLATAWVLALRAELGAIYNTEQPRAVDGENRTRRVPTLNRFYSGGKGRMRGLGRRLISPYRVGAFRLSEEFSKQAPAPGDVELVPVGGLTKLEISVEPRFRLVRDLLEVGDLWGALYYDAASVLGGQWLVQTSANASLGLGVVSSGELLDSLIHSVGAGAWWVTPIGPVRLDFAWTLSSLTDDPRFRTCQNVVTEGVNDPVETGLGDCDWVPLAGDPLQKQLNLDYSFLIGIGHSF